MSFSVSLTSNDIWHKNCITQTTPWSPCSKTCGRGISQRLSNDNAGCMMEKESRLCNLRPCEVDITKHFRVRIHSYPGLFVFHLHGGMDELSCHCHGRMHWLSYLLLSRVRNAWTSTVSQRFRTSPSRGVSVRRRIGPSTVESVPMSAAASHTSLRPSRWSLCVQMGQFFPGSTCGSTPASATSPAGIQTISLQISSNTMRSMRLLTNYFTECQIQSLFMASSLGSHL